MEGSPASIIGAMASMPWACMASGAAFSFEVKVVLIFMTWSEPFSPMAKRPLTKPLWASSGVAGNLAALTETMA